MHSSVNVRPAEASELDYLARLWHEVWLESHAKLLPPELHRFRTLESFTQRLQDALPSVRVTGPVGSPAGFHIVKDDELYQLYVSAQSRGAGVAAALLADAEAQLAASGVATAWLACAMGNERAARFYEKSGWIRVGNMINHLETPDGDFPLETWRYEKKLRAGLQVITGI